VYRLTLAIVGNEADAADATQDAFVAAWRQIRGLRDPVRSAVATRRPASPSWSNRVSWRSPG
jgi:DNA-directed RNA polymerase specialized sigma24 family protein